MKTNEKLILIFYACITISQAARILGGFTIPARSHFTCNNAVLKALAEAGHSVTVVTSFPRESAKENFTSVIDISNGSTNFVSQSSAEDFMNFSLSDTFDFVLKVEFSICEKTFSSKQIQKILSSKEKLFDVLIVESYFMPRCYYWIARKLNIPIISVVTLRSSFQGDWEISNPRHPVLQPLETSRTMNYENFYDRISNVIQIFEASVYQYTKLFKIYYQFHQKYIKSEIPFNEFMDLKTSLIFVNSHSSYFPRPLNPNMIEIGGIHLNKNRNLPENIQKFMNEAYHGAILFSFGSVTRAAKMPKDKILAFKKAFAKIPQRVIWKYEENMEEVPDNVLLLEWLPQQDILAHENTKVFISHSGQGAIHESLNYGVPLISCPLFVDQHLNANIFENLGIAVRLDYKTITEKTILEALNEIMNNTKYREKIQKLSKIFNDRAMTPQQTVVYYTEYVIRHNGTHHLTSTAVKLNWFQYFLLDVISFIILFLFSILVVCYFIIKLCCSRVQNYFNGIKKNKNE